jgi:hypothetical protein
MELARLPPPQQKRLQRFEPEAAKLALPAAVINLPLDLWLAIAHYVTDGSNYNELSMCG